MKRITAIILAPLLACGTNADSDAISQRALQATANPAHADGKSVIITMVAPNGVFTCEKPGGGAFTSDGMNPVVQLRIDGNIVEEKFYNKNGDGPDEIIVFATTATSKSLGLNPGKHLAQCSALPDWPDLDPETNPDEQWLSCETETPAAPACTFSGTLEFLVQEVDVAPPVVVDLSTTLDGNCGNGQGGGKRLCTGWIDLPPGEFGFKFPCVDGSAWDIHLKTLNSKSKEKSLAILTKLSAFDGGGNPAPPSASKKEDDETTLQVQVDGICEARVTSFDSARVKLTVASHGAGLSSEACHEMCVTKGTAYAGANGCDCGPYCASLCKKAGVTCGDLPECNIDFGVVSDDFGRYDCPFKEKDIKKQDCQAWNDGGKFEHQGSCYRCSDGQQCCYTDGLDNGTGSFDLCPPFSILEGPNGCFGFVHHCRCDVTPLCACLAVQGEIELCEACIGISDDPLDGCNAWGDDAEFCTNAVKSAKEGFDWCGILGDPQTCMKLP